MFVFDEGLTPGLTLVPTPGLTPYPEPGCGI